MITSAQKVRLGIFVFFSFLTVVAMFLFFFSAALFKKYDHYFINFKDISVSGLDIGSQVKYHGLRIGKIANMEIDMEDVSIIIVDIAVDQGDSIKSDVSAVITPLGITGLMMIELRGGTSQAPYLKPNDFLKTGSSLTASISGKAEVIVEKLELVLNNLIEITGPANRDNVALILESSASSLDITRRYLKKNEKTFQELTVNLNEAVINARYLLSDMRTTAHKIEEIATSDAFNETFVNLADITRAMKKVNWDSTMLSLQDAVINLDNLLSDMNRNADEAESDVLQSIAQIRQITEELSEFTRKINNNPALLLKGANRDDAKKELPELDP